MGFLAYLSNKLIAVFLVILTLFFGQWGLSLIGAGLIRGKSFMIFGLFILFLALISLISAAYFFKRDHQDGFFGRGFFKTMGHYHHHPKREDNTGKIIISIIIIILVVVLLKQLPLKLGNNDKSLNLNNKNPNTPSNVEKEVNVIDVDKILNDCDEQANHNGIAEIPQGKCYLGLSNYLGGVPEICDRMLSKMYHDKCYQFIALNTLNTSWCKKFEYIDSIRQCIEPIAVATKDVKICDEIDSGLSRETCVKYVTEGYYYNPDNGQFWKIEN